MNRERAKELLPIMQAYVDGKEVQYFSVSDNWTTTDTPKFYSSSKYRIKPELRVFWINPKDKNDSPAWWLTQEEYESGKWDTKDYIKTIEDLSDD